MREQKDGRVGGQERQWCEIVWALRQPKAGMRLVVFEECARAEGWEGGWTGEAMV